MRPLFPAYSVAQRRGGLVAPTITVAPVLTWTVAIGGSPAITPPTYTGSPGTITYTLRRDGVAVGGLTDVSEATIEAHVGVSADIWPDIDVVATVTNGAGSDSEGSNVVAYALSQHWRHVYDAANASATAGLVDSIDDTGSHGGINVTATLLERPTLNATDAGFNNEPSITFDGTTDNLRNTDVDLNAALTSAQIFACMRIESASAANQCWVTLHNNTDSLRLRQVGADATAKPRWTSVSTAVNSDWSTVPGEGVEILCGGAWTGGTSQFIYNGSTQEDTDTPVETSIGDVQQLFIGALGGPTPTLFANVTIALVVIALNTVDSAARTHLLAYCQNRFGVP